MSALQRLFSLGELIAIAYTTCTLSFLAIAAVLRRRS